MKYYQHISTDRVENEHDWDYGPIMLDDLLAIGFLVEVEKNEAGEWVKVTHE